MSTPATPKGNATDYSSYPPLHNMPTVGQTIAYKVIFKADFKQLKITIPCIFTSYLIVKMWKLFQIVEMSENYCPLVSEYKVSIDEIFIRILF